MRFHDRQYSVFLILAGPDAPALWRSSVWLPFAKDLEPFATSARGKAALRTVQHEAGGKTAAFGRLGWNEKSHAKWSHADGHNDHLKFLNVEAWAPGWSQSAREDIAPDFYMSLLSERTLRPAKTLRFSQRLICAVAKDEGEARSALLERLLTRWAVALQAPFFARQSRAWGYGDDDRFSWAVQDMIISGLFKPGDPHLREFDGTSLMETWTTIPVGGE